MKKIARAYHVYRHFDAKGALLYVGACIDPVKRLQGHRRSPWFSSIARVKTQGFATKEEALAAEAEAIRKERPRFNQSPGALLVAQRHQRQTLPKKDRPPIHPGAVLRGFLSARDKTEVAKLLGVSRQNLHAILEEKRRVTPGMALKIGKLTGTEPGTWIEQQDAFRLWHLVRDSAFMAKIDRIPTLQRTVVPAHAKAAIEEALAARRTAIAAMVAHAQRHKLP